ncbi:hypothetical protein TRVL_08284 [Trypanosoma vivax]|nr:hypothetical protein TRVL_08284 [Trypanosoma vivax]
MTLHRLSAIPTSLTPARAKSPSRSTGSQCPSRKNLPHVIAVPPNSSPLCSRLSASPPMRFFLCDCPACLSFALLTPTAQAPLFLWPSSLLWIGRAATVWAGLVTFFLRCSPNLFPATLCLYTRC